MNAIKNILLIINFEKNIPIQFIDTLNAVFKDNGCVCHTLADTDEYLKQKSMSIDRRVISTSNHLKSMDIAIVLGGDGSILMAASTLSAYPVPILGINFGTLGYMAELEAGDVGLVDSVIAGNFLIEERMMLSPKILKSDGSTVMMPPSLNDIVLSNGPVARLLNFNVICNGVLIEECRADGMVIATPTGSTAYSMSAGGPILAPGLNAFCLTPICPHSFSNRPVILPGDSVIELSDIGALRDNSAYVTLDGRLAEKVEVGDRISITRSESVTRLVRLKNNSFLRVLSSKLQDI